MNGSPKLQFNLGARPDCRNLATHFDPDNEPPVVISKLGNNVVVETVGLSKTPRDAFKAVNPERLAYAVELARRKVQKARRSYSEAISCSCDSTEKTGTIPKSPEEVRGPVHFEKQENKKEKKIHSQVKGANSSGRKKLGGKVTDEIASLNAELERQLMLLGDGNNRRATDKSWKRHSIPPRHVSTQRWEVEEEEDKEKLERWRKEQQSRTARMMYDLSQQVKDLEKKIDRMQHCDLEIRQQSEVVKKLTAAQRAALRTLQTFGGPRGWASEDIPPELTLLIQQIALLSTQLGEGEGGANSEITASVLQLVKTMEERQRIARLLKKQGQEVKGHHADNGISIPIPVKHVKKRERASRRLSPRVGVLFDPQLQKKRTKSQINPKNTHYTQGTFNSLRRQQPPVEYGMSFSSPSRAQGSVLNSSVLRPCQLLLSSSPNKDIKVKKMKKGKVASKIAASNASGRNNNEPDSKDDKHSAYSEGLGGCLGVGGGDNLRKNDSQEQAPGEANLTAVIARQNDQLELLRDEISHKLTELKAAFPSREADSSRDQGKSDDHTESPVKSSASSPVSATGPAVSDGNLSQMLRRLDELEAEENEIRKRWTSVVYEDIGTNHRQSTRNTGSHAPPTAPPTTCDTSTLDKGSLHDYREHYSRYLGCTGVSTSGGFNPWNMAERIADDLLDEVVEGVAGEVGQVCDDSVEKLYNLEFQRPP